MAPAPVLPSGAFLPPVLPAYPKMDPPPGYVLKTYFNGALLGGGGLVLAVTWGSSIGYGASQDFDNGLGALAVPVLGPWMALGKRDFSCDVRTTTDITGIEDSQNDVEACIANQTSTAGFLVGLGVGQLVGTALLTVGILDRRKRWVRMDIAGLQVDWDAVATPAFSGVSARGQF
jgi:hypothetical protein